MFVWPSRAGYRPDRVSRRSRVGNRNRTGSCPRRMEEIETAGIIEAINSMLLQSHDGVIRVFPNWDQTRRRGVQALRAVGASWSRRIPCRGQVVDSVRIFQRKGQCLRAAEPVRRALHRRDPRGQSQPVPSFKTRRSSRFSYDRRLTYEIAAPRMSTRSAGARSSRASQGRNVVLSPRRPRSRCQRRPEPQLPWQKNRADIPGATSRVIPHRPRRCGISAVRSLRGLQPLRRDRSRPRDSALSGTPTLPHPHSRNVVLPACRTGLHPGRSRTTASASSETADKSLDKDLTTWC